MSKILNNIILNLQERNAGLHTMVFISFRPR